MTETPSTMLELGTVLRSFSLPDLDGHRSKVVPRWNTGLPAACRARRHQSCVAAGRGISNDTKVISGLASVIM